MTVFASILAIGENGLAIEPSWEQITPQAAFRTRDSAGEIVYDGKMWILGGWYSSYVPTLRDVWSSADGVTWTCATTEAPWHHGVHAVTLAYNNKMWTMGGCADGRLPGASDGNDVWYSTDGASWTEATSAASWSARDGAGGAVFNNKMWILGGSEFYGSTDALNDVWSSSDGVNWSLATSNAPWSPRAYHQVLTYDDKLWVIGGGNYYLDYTTPWDCNDVWSSPDGVNWTNVTANAPWDARMWHSAVVYDDKMWVLGGWKDSSESVSDDVWYSTDGANWTQLTTESIWPARHEASAYVFDNSMWVVAGGASPLLNDVWRIDVAPEPGSLALLSIGLSAVFIFTWRRRR